MPAWRPLKAPSLEEFEVIAVEAFRRLPENFRVLCADLVIKIDDFRPTRCSTIWARRASSTCSACSRGSACRSASESAPVHMPNMVWLYRRPILDYWAEHDETLGAIVTHVLVHEIGHHFGMSDDDMEAIEASVAELREEWTMKVDGACNCGNITIEGEADPETVSICHCTDCQTGDRHGVPRLGADLRRDVQGHRQPTIYIKTTADSGNPRAQAFCPKCGSPLYSTTPGEGQQAMYIVRVGDPAAARSARAEAADLVALGAAVGHRRSTVSARSRSRRDTGV